MAPIQTDSEHGSMKPASFFLKAKVWMTGNYTHVVTIPAYLVKEIGIKQGDELDMMVRVSKKR